MGLGLPRGGPKVLTTYMGPDRFWLIPLVLDGLQKKAYFPKKSIFFFFFWVLVKKNFLEGP